MNRYYCLATIQNALLILYLEGQTNNMVTSMCPAKYNKERIWGKGGFQFI